jgi:hypothetical protein
MTNLTSHVTDLETSRKLKEIGCPHNGLFWHEVTNSTWDGEKWRQIIDSRYGKLGGAYFYYPCWLLSELIEILGDKFICLDWFKDPISSEKIYRAEGTLYRVSGNTPIQAVANLIIKLNEEGILQFNQIQK